MKTLDAVARRRRTRSATRSQRVRVETAQGEWFGWARTRTPLYGTRSHGRIALRPGGQSLWLILVALIVAAAFTHGWLRLAIGATAGVAVVVIAVTILWKPHGRCYAHSLRAGSLVRLPRRPWTAARIEKADHFDGLIYLDFHGGTSLVYEPHREVTRVRLYGKPAYLWVHGRVMGAINWGALPASHKRTRWAKLRHRY